METSKTLTFFTPKASTGNGAILVDTGISAGFPSPVDDFSETRISLDDELVKNNLYCSNYVINKLIDAGGLDKYKNVRMKYWKNSIQK